MGETKTLEMLNLSDATLSRSDAIEEDGKMQTAVSKHESGITHSHGIVYRTICRNPGCGFEFDLKITPENASLLSGSMACPHCKRNGGQLKSQGRVGEKLFAAKLLFRTTGAGATD
jgi:hypothetical protein